MKCWQIVIFLFLTFFTYCSSKEHCNEPCSCNRTTSWNGLSFIEAIKNVPVLDCFEKDLKEIPNPIHDSFGILLLNNNSIQKLEIIGFPKRLEALQLNYNELNQVGIFEARELRYLHLLGNQFTRIPVTCQSIEYMDLDQNQIDSDPENNLLTYKKLKQLDIRSNKFETLPEMPPSIIVANFEENRIKFINYNILNKLPNLKQLFLASNDIYKIYLPEAYYLLKMERVDIEGNPVEIDTAVQEWCKREKLQHDICIITH